MTATVMLPLKLLAGEQIEFGCVEVESTGTMLLSATAVVVKFVHPVS